jgi:hypothetical protein
MIKKIVIPSSNTKTVAILEEKSCHKKKVGNEIVGKSERRCLMKDPERSRRIGTKP